MVRKKLFLLFPLLLLLLCFDLGQASAVPAYEKSIQLSQPEGTTFQAHQWGDEWNHGWETIDDYTIIQDDTTKEWFYAELDSQGNLQKSPSRVSNRLQASSIEGSTDKIKKHIRPQKKQTPFNSPSLNNASRVVSSNGTDKFPVIMINFSDTTPTFTKANFQNNLFGTGTGGLITGPGTLTDYYKEVSNNQLTITGTVVGWYTASKSHNYYGANDAYGDDQHPAELVKEAVQAAVAAGVDFSQYDNDNDGYVDNVIVIHQGTAEEQTGIGTASDIWSHNWSLSGAGVGTVTVGGKIANVYTIQPEKFGSNIMGIGVFAHELGHTLGLPDLYDTSGGSQGVGNWCLMSAGSWGTTTNPGDTPVHVSAWCKSKLGWITPTQATSDTSLTMPPIENSPNSVVQLLNNPGGVDWVFYAHSGTGEYFLLENREKTKFDNGLPGEGLLIWHVNETVTCTNQANNLNNGNTLVYLEQADGLRYLDLGYNRGDTGDPYPGSSNNSTFDKDSSPSSTLNNGSDSTVALSNITRSGNNITVNLEITQILASLSALPASPQAAGTTITWSCAASGGTSLYYQFWLQGPSGNWEIAQAYSTSNTWSWTPTTAGSYAVCVWVKDASSSSQYDKWIVANYTVSAASTPVTISSVTPNKASPQAVGTTITWSCAASGGTSLYYQFWLQGPSGNWEIAQAYSTSNTWSWTPTTAGSYAVSVWVKDASSSSQYDKWIAANYTVSAASTPVTISSVTPNKASPQAVGTTITWSCAASGGTSLYYQFWLQGPSGNWEIAQAYSTSNTWSWTPTTAGSYAVSVWVKDASSSSQYDKWIAANYTVSAASTPVTISSVTPNKASPQAAGTTITWSCAASGGTSLYYQFWLQGPSGNWEIAQAYSTSNTWSWTPTTAGSYAVSVNYRLLSVSMTTYWKSNKPGQSPNYLMGLAARTDNTMKSLLKRRRTT